MTPLDMLAAELAAQRIVLRELIRVVLGDTPGAVALSAAAAVEAEPIAAAGRAAERRARGAIRASVRALFEDDDEPRH
jgi:hypothetical protein